MYLCQEVDCNEKFESRTSLKHHQDQFHPKRIYNCDLCSEKHAGFKKFQIHKRKKHQVKIVDTENVCCKLCQRVFQGMSALRRHNSTVHKNVKKFKQSQKTRKKTLKEKISNSQSRKKTLKEKKTNMRQALFAGVSGYTIQTYHDIYMKSQEVRFSSINVYTLDLFKKLFQMATEEMSGALQFNYTQEYLDQMMKWEQAFKTIIMQTDDVGQFWIQMIEIFKDDARFAEYNPHFNLENTSATDFHTQISIFRQLVGACYRRVLPIFTVDDLHEEDDYNAAALRKDVAEELARKKIIVEVHIDFLIAEHYLMNHANTIVKIIERISNSDTDDDEKCSLLKDIMDKVCYLFTSIEQLDVDYLVHGYRENLAGLTKDLEVHKTLIENLVNTKLTSGILFKACGASVSLLYQADILNHDPVQETDEEFNELLNKIGLFNTDMDIGMDENEEISEKDDDEEISEEDDDDVSSQETFIDQLFNIEKNEEENSFTDDAINSENIPEESQEIASEERADDDISPVVHSRSDDEESFQDGFTNDTRNGNLLSDTDNDISDTDQFQHHQTIRNTKRKLDFSVEDCRSKNNPKRWRYDMREQHNEPVIMDNEMLPVSDSDESGSDIVELADFQSEDDYSHNDAHDSRSILFDNDLQIFPPEQPTIENQCTNIIDDLVDNVVPQPQPPIVKQDSNNIDQPIDQVESHPTDVVQDQAVVQVGATDNAISAEVVQGDAVNEVGPTDNVISEEVVQDEAVDVAPPQQSPIPAYNQVKLRPEPVFQVWLNLTQYKSLSKKQKEQISNRWEKEVSYPKKLRDRFSLRSTPSKIRCFMNHYKTYFENEEITFSIQVKFNGNVENADHEQNIFKSLFQSTQIKKPKDAQFPTNCYIFSDIIIRTFDNFVSTFSVE